MRRSITITAAALALCAGAVPVAAPAGAAASSGSPCPAAPAQAEKKKGLGGLLGAARSSGLLGSVMGATRGDGNLESDLAGTARAAATDAANTAAACAEQAIGDAAESKAGRRPAAEQQGRPVRSSAPASATERARRQMAAEDVKYPSRMPPPADFAAVKAAYDAFGKVRCSDCEGGYSYDGWPSFPRDEYAGKYNGDAQRLGNLPIGHVLRWRGAESNGTLTIVTEETVNGFRCRRLRYRLEKGTESAERPGLICWGRANEYAGSESWNTVY